MPPKLIILDDVFPLPLSAFRYTEYTNYLERIENSAVYSNGACLKLLGETRPVDAVIIDFEKDNPHFAGRVLPYAQAADVGALADLIYFVFLGNARNFKQDLIKSGKPFVFTLYPGGSFEPFQKKTNDLLKEIMALPGFRKVIVTQPFVRDYLINGGFCRQEKIVLIPGVVVPEEFLRQGEDGNGGDCAANRRHRSAGNQRPDGASNHQNDGGRDNQRHERLTNICFVAYKYLPDGKDKGYDIFMNVARRLIAGDRNLRFHVVGGFGPGDVYDADILPFVEFRERMNSEALLDFFADMDILISPNRAGVPAIGKFDGFPTGAAVHAALQGVAVFATDSIWQNHYLRDREEIVVTTHSPTEIAALVEIYLKDKEKLRALQAAGQAAFHRLYGFEAQMKPRIDLLQAELASLVRA